MSSLPPALNFAETEEEICKQWAAEKTFKTQDKLSLERGDEVSLNC
jgi:isoleucyl-tRNA synthetase